MSRPLRTGDSIIFEYSWSTFVATSRTVSKGTRGKVLRVNKWAHTRPRWLYTYDVETENGHVVLVTGKNTIRKLGAQDAIQSLVS